MSWESKRDSVKQKLDIAATMNVNTMSVDELQRLRTDYDRIQRSLTAFLKTSASNYNLSDKLEETGTLQTQIQHLYDENETMKTDVDTAIARDELLRSKDQTGNGHSLYVLDRPVRRGMIPYLWILSVLFVGVGVLLFYWLTPMILLPAVTSTNAFGASTGGSILQMLMDVLTNRLTWMALFGAACVVILFLSLKIAGVFGK